jgi:hypothetical protein
MPHSGSTMFVLLVAMSETVGPPGTRGRCYDSRPLKDDSLSSSVGDTATEDVIDAEPATTGD